MGNDSTRISDNRPWYAGVTRYEWLVLIIACAGWVFDVYEGQIYNITRQQMLTEIVGGDASNVAWYGEVFLGAFLLGGTVGGLAAGVLADRYGRRPVMVATILMYSLFSGLTYFASEPWHVALLRFLVAVGVGGEWAVAASLVSEVFPARARAHASGIFHASSVIGTWLATLAGLAVGAQWRYAYLIGVAPALLILWVRASLREPERWKATAAEARSSSRASAELGSLRVLLSQSPWNIRALLGMGLAAVGLGTFWAVSIASQNLAHDFLISAGMSEEEAAEEAKFAYGFVQTAGGGLGLLAFGPLSARIGRRLTFVIFHLAAFVLVPITCYVPQSYMQLLLVLPVFGFFTLGMHAGYAIYFPELFPTNLRATGASFCFNGGRLATAGVMYVSAELKSIEGINVRESLSILGLLFLVGAFIVLFLPETNRQELPE
jgi:MFS family permease